MEHTSLLTSSKYSTNSNTAVLGTDLTLSCTVMSAKINTHQLAIKKEPNWSVVFGTRKQSFQTKISKEVTSPEWNNMANFTVSPSDHLVLKLKDRKQTIAKYSISVMKLPTVKTVQYYKLTLKQDVIAEIKLNCYVYNNDINNNSNNNFNNNNNSNFNSNNNNNNNDNNDSKNNLLNFNRKLSLISGDLLVSRKSRKFGTHKTSADTSALEESCDTPLLESSVLRCSTMSSLNSDPNIRSSRRLGNVWTVSSDMIDLSNTASNTNAYGSSSTLSSDRESLQSLTYAPSHKDSTTQMFSHVSARVATPVITDVEPKFIDNTISNRIHVLGESLGRDTAELIELRIGSVSCIDMVESISNTDICINMLANTINNHNNNNNNVLYIHNKHGVYQTTDIYLSISNNPLIQINDDTTTTTTTTANNNNNTNNNNNNNIYDDYSVKSRRTFSHTHHKQDLLASANFEKFTLNDKCIDHFTLSMKQSTTDDKLYNNNSNNSSNNNNNNNNNTLDVENTNQPEITGMGPKQGPLEGNIQLTIRGTNLGQTRDDILRVGLAGIDCTKSVEYYSEYKLVITVPPTLHPTSGPILVETLSGGVGFSGMDFQYVDEKNLGVKGPIQLSRSPSKPQLGGKSTKPTQREDEQSKLISELTSTNNQLKITNRALTDEVKRLQEYIDTMTLKIITHAPELLINTHS